jgi:hypothetical protein
MISGQQTLSSIDEALIAERRTVSQIEQEIAGLNAQRTEQQQAQVQDYRELARVRVDVLASDGLLQHLDDAERQVVALLEQRRDAAEELDRRIAVAAAAIGDREQERAVSAAKVDAAVKAVDGAEARTQARLDADPAYRAQREQAHEAERTARHAAEKASRSEEEKEQKGESYRNDPFFMYLWSRDFGLPGYRAGFLARWLDGRVARLIGFADARANYARLSEIPERLRGHAEGLAAAAEAEFQSLRDLDTAARATDGIPALEEQLAAQQAQLDGIDRRLDEEEAQHQRLLQDKAAFAAGEDEHMRTAVSYLADELQREDLARLRQEAMATPFPDDDVIVSRILKRHADLQTLAASSASLKEAIEQHGRRLGEIESLRADFKRSRFDRTGSMFGDGALVALMISNFVNGMLDRRTLWRVLQEQQRYQPQYSDPGFGSGGFGRGTVWGGGLGDILGELERGGMGRGRGGFGGGWGGGHGGGGGGGLGGGGGGFRTGGGF